MPGYYGTDEQQALQALAESSVPEIAATPGLCQNGRMLGCDDVDALGWPRIFDILARDGFIGFRLLQADRRAELEAKLSEKGFRLDTWDLFLGDRDMVLPICEAIAQTPLHDGLRVLPPVDQPKAPYTRAIQELIAATGVVPFSGSLLAGALGPAKTVVIGISTEGLAAAAHTYLPHNTHSGRHRYAWGGLVAVAEGYRGHGLGRAINAHLTVAACNDLGATHLYEMISSTNIPSRRMAEACGLRRAPEFLCGAVTRMDRQRYTR